MRSCGTRWSDNPCVKRRALHPDSSQERVTGLRGSQSSGPLLRACASRRRGLAANKIPLLESRMARREGRRTSDKAGRTILSAWTSSYRRSVAGSHSLQLPTRTCRVQRCLSSTAVLGITRVGRARAARAAMWRSHAMRDTVELADTHTASKCSARCPARDRGAGTATAWT